MYLYLWSTIKPPIIKTLLTIRVWGNWTCNPGCVLAPVLNCITFLFLRLCWSRQTDPIEFVENICENMQLFPKEDFLTGDQLMFEYEPQVTRTTESVWDHTVSKSIFSLPTKESVMILDKKWLYTCLQMSKTSVCSSLYFSHQERLHPKHIVCLCVQVISAALSLLTPERANLLLLSPENEGHCPLREKWFGTCYSVDGMAQT